MNGLMNEAFNADLYLEELEEDIYNEEVDSILEEDSNFLLELEMDDSEFASLEGANIEALKNQINGYKEFFTHSIAAKKAIKAKNYSEAKAEVSKAKAKLNEAITAINKSESDVGSVVFALFTGGIPRIARSISILSVSLVTGLGIGTVLTPVVKATANAYISTFSELEKMVYGLKTISTSEALKASLGAASIKVVSIGAWCNMVIKLLEEVIGIINNIKNKNKEGKDITVDDFNIYKIHTINALKELLKSCDKLEKTIDERAKLDKLKDKKEKEVKESEQPSKEFIMDCLEFAMYDEDDDDLVTEGFNSDIKSEYKDNIKEIKAILKSVKATVKTKNYKEAKKSLDNLDKKIDKMIADIEKKEGTFTDATFGYLRKSFVATAKIIAATLITLPLVGIGGIVVSIEEYLKDIYGVASKISSKIANKEEVTPDDFNLFKNSLITKLKGFKSIIDKTREKINKLEKEDMDKKKKEVKESVDTKLHDEKLKLYEACRAGEITEDEREILLSRIGLASKVEESVEVNDINSEDYSNRDGFDIVKKDIYERCAKGEFDVDRREELIKEAYARFFEGCDNIDGIVDSVKKKSTLDQDAKKLTSDIQKTNNDINQNS